MRRTIVFAVLLLIILLTTTMATLAATYTKTKTETWSYPFGCYATAQGTFEYETGKALTGVRLSKTITESPDEFETFIMSDGITTITTYDFYFYYRLEKLVGAEIIEYRTPALVIKTNGPY